MSRAPGPLLLPAAARVAAPWKNGGGLTREICLSPRRELPYLTLTLTLNWPKHQMPRRRQTRSGEAIELVVPRVS